MTEEVWFTHPEHPWHEVSSHGNVRVAVKSSKFGMEPGSHLTGSWSAKGYHQVRIKHIDGGSKLCWVHRLVLEAFVGYAPDGYVTRHRDGDPRNNRLDNLCWGTQVENQADRKLHGTDNSGERNPMYQHGWYT
jgi:HNH endonuclease